MVILFAVVVDADQLHDGLFNEEDRSNDNTSLKHHLYRLDPVFVLRLDHGACRLVEVLPLVEDIDEARGTPGNNGPEEDRKWNLKCLEDERVLANAGADESTCHLKDEWDSLSDELANP